MGARGCVILLLVFLTYGLVLSSSATGRIRRDVHRIIIREQIPRGRGPHHQYRAPAHGYREHVDGRHRAPYDSHEYSDEYEVIKFLFQISLLQNNCCTIQNFIKFSFMHIKFENISRVKCQNCKESVKNMFLIQLNAIEMFTFTYLPLYLIPINFKISNAQLIILLIFIFPCFFFLICNVKLYIISVLFLISLCIYV